MLPLIIGDNPFIDDFNDLLQMIPALKDRGDNIQKLFQLQIVVIPYTPFRQILAVYMGKAYDAVAESGQSILTGISLQRGVEWVNQKLCALTLLPLGKQTGKCDFQNALILPNPDPLHS